MNRFLILLAFLGLTVNVVNSQPNYPKNGLIFSKEFRATMDTTCNKRASHDLPKGKTWIFFNENNDFKERVPFTVGENGQEGGALCSRVFDEIGIRTTTKMPPKGTIIGTFKIGKIEDREKEKIPHYTLKNLLMSQKMGRTDKSEINLFFVIPSYIKMRLDKNLHLISEVKRDTVVRQQLYTTYNADLNLKHDEWVTVAITYDTKTKRLVYYANGQKAGFDNMRISYDDKTESTQIWIAETNFGDIAVSSIGIYNRILSEEELLALTGGGKSEFTEAPLELAKPRYRMNWTAAYIQLGLALLFILINILTKRWRFVPTTALAVGGVFAMLAVFVRGVLPYIPGGFNPIEYNGVYGTHPVNLPDTLSEQFAYVASFELPGVLISLFLCIAVSFVKDSHLNFLQKALNFIFPLLALAVLFFVGKFGAMAFFIAFGIILVGFAIISFANGPSDVLINVNTGANLGQTFGAATAGSLMFIVFAIVAIILVAYLLSNVYIFLFNFFFIYILIKNYFMENL